MLSQDDTVATLLSENVETAAMLVCKTNPVGFELFPSVNTSFCSNKFAVGHVSENTPLRNENGSREQII